MTTPQSQAHADAMRCASALLNQQEPKKTQEKDAAIIIQQLKLDALYECVEALRYISARERNNSVNAETVTEAIANKALAALDKGKV